jgi:hypothetical protein
MTNNYSCLKIIIINIINFLLNTVILIKYGSIIFCILTLLAKTTPIVYFISKHFLTGEILAVYHEHHKKNVILNMGIPTR